MFTDELINVLEKYQGHYIDEINQLNQSINDIVKTLEKIRNSLIDNLSEILKDRQESKALYDNIQLLNEQIDKINIIPIAKNDNTKYSFRQKVRVFKVEDDLCPECYVKLMPFNIHYDRYCNQQIYQQNIKWYRCPICKKFFALDIDLESFDIENTNIEIVDKYYNQIPKIDVYSLIVLSNTLNCSKNHKTKDIMAQLPVMDSNGDLHTELVSASYCFDCKRFTILKDTFKNIDGIILCKIVDETSESIPSDTSEIEIVQKQSVLYQYGYNVQTQKNLSDKQRHTILSLMIEANIMSRREIIQHLISLISRGSKIPLWKNATQKWTEDKEYVEHYNENSLPQIYFDKLILKYREPK